MGGAQMRGSQACRTPWLQMSSCVGWVAGRRPPSPTQLPSSPHLDPRTLAAHHLGRRPQRGHQGRGGGQVRGLLTYHALHTRRRQCGGVWRRCRWQRGRSLSCVDAASLRKKLQLPRLSAWCLMIRQPDRQPASQPDGPSPTQPTPPQASSILNAPHLQSWPLPPLLQSRVS